MAGGRMACACLVALIGGSADTRPDLVETAVSVSQHGASVRVTDVVRNRGGTTAPPSTSGYYLAHARIGDRSVGDLRPRASSRRSRTLTIPSSVRPGSYRLHVCADDRHRVGESNERNNCRAATQTVEVADRTPPSFAGLKAATTCIPGPAGGPPRSSSYHLRWDAAADNVTRSSAIVYDVYQATEAGGESFGTPTYTTPPGATAFSTPPLPDDKGYFFVVRAKDEAGNRELNRRERPGVNLCV